MTQECPTCGNPLLEPSSNTLSPAELDALSAWWHMGSIRAAANLLSRSERTVINQLYKARIRDGVHTTSALLRLHMAEIRTKSELIRSHKYSGRKAA